MWKFSRLSQEWDNKKTPSFSNSGKYVMINTTRKEHKQHKPDIRNVLRANLKDQYQDKNRTTLEKPS